jgi:prolyl-tRNA editing enzyme YbaK/EbsC (Cys-tRNA(Pro) deacylase)
MKYHPIVKKIIDTLTERSVVFETFEHAPVRTSEEAAALRPEYSLHQGAKALIVKIKPHREGKEFVMLVFPADARFDPKKVKPLLGAKEINFATEEEVLKITGGVLVGGVPPFGNLFGLDVFADHSLFANDEIIFNAGDRSFSIAMKSADYKRTVNPIVADIVKI